MAKRKSNAANRTRQASRARRGRSKLPRPSSIQFEALEPRQLLAAVTVGNALDVVNAPDLSSIAALVNDDGGDGISLREAMTAANNTAGADTITFDSPLSGATISLSGGELEVTDTLTIDASSLDSGVTVDAQLNSRILHFSASTGDLTLDSLTLQNGRTTAESEEGGGIHFGSSGLLSLTNSAVSDSSTEGDFSGGGGIFSNNGTVDLTGSTVSGNSTAGSISAGGGVFTLSGDINLTNSTVSGNSVATSGGGIGTFFGNVSINSSTVTDNSAGFDGGGVFVFNSGPAISITNSIVAGNTDNGGTPNDLDPDPNGLLTINYSLIGVADGLTVSGNVGNQTGTSANPLDPMLGPLADNGGPTQTHALLPGSPALSAGDPAAVAGQNGVPEFDQRGTGFDRIRGRIDMGSFERQTEVPSLVVTSTSDIVDPTDFQTSLREAINFANDPAANGGTGDADNDGSTHDTITFDASLSGQTIALASGELVISDSLTIDVSDLDANVVIDAQQNSRVLNFSSTGDLALNGLTLRNGRTVDSDGGGILFSSNGWLRLTDSTVIGNNTTGSFVRGGGIYANGNVDLTNSTVSGNNALHNGGGVYTRGSLTMTSSTVSGNNATVYSGGGINADGNVVLTNSTVSGNGARNYGGGINAYGNVTLINSTVSGNNAGYGGGIHNRATALAIENSTIANNYASYQGGGIYHYGSGGPQIVSIANSVIAGNADGYGSPDLFVNTHNLLVNFTLIGNTSGSGITGGTGAGNILDQPAMLGPLADNGGPTQTHALLPGSPAIDAGDPNFDPNVFTPPMVHDQRGTSFDRVANGRIDMGSFERQTEAPSLVVTSASDIVDPTDFQTSLREAIAFSNDPAANGGTGDADNDGNAHDTIAFDAALSGQTVALIGGELSITDSLTIDASSLASKVVVDAQQNSRVLNFTALTGDLTLNGLTVQNGRTAIGDYDGGGGIGFQSGGDLTVTNSIITGNSTTYHGGGIYTYSGDVFLIDSTVRGNSSEKRGGGVFSRYGNVNLMDARIEQNATTGFSGFGGGIYTREGDVSLERSAVVGNSTIGAVANGGGIATQGGSVALTASTVSGNNASGDDARGGGIATYGPSVSVVGSTISGNSSGFFGGGIRAENTTVLIENSTVTDNSAADIGGGISLRGHYTDDDRLTVLNSIVAGNTDNGTSPEIQPPYDPANDLAVDFSLIGDTTGSAITGSTGTGNILNQSAQLGPLADNGGATQTHVLLLGSPALDAGDPSIVVDPSEFDQRGAPFLRVANDRIDMGAFEQQDAKTFVVTTADDELDDLDGIGTVSLANFGGAGDLSLREAIALANLDPTTSDTITFASDPGQAFENGGTIYLAPALNDLKVTGSLTIDGDLTDDGTADVTLDADSAAGLDDADSRVLTIDDGDLAKAIEVTIDGLIVRDGVSIAMADGDQGGGIFVGKHDSLTLRNGVVDSNSAGGSGPGNGGGIFVDNDGTLSLTNVMVRNNTALENSGGGISGNDGVTVLVTDSEISGNFAEQDGGGINLETNTSLSIVRSVITGNRSNSDGGGGFYLDAGSTMNLVDSTVSNNRAFDGGGFYLLGSVGTVVNSTISGNIADDQNGSGGDEGGGIYLGNSSLTMTNTTVAHNKSLAGGGGIYLRSGSNLTATNSTISGNFTEGYGSSGGGGMFVDSSSALTLANTIVLGNDSATSDDEIMLDGAATQTETGPTIVGTRLFDGAGGSSTLPGTVTDVANSVFAETLDFVDLNGDGVQQLPDEVTLGTDILAGKLANNGGSVPMVALEGDTSNPALDAAQDDQLDEAVAGIDLNGDGDMTDVITTDARGLDRFVDIAGVANNGTNLVDLGAFERQDQVPKSCDFDSDLDCDLDDIDALVAEIAAGTNNGAFDLTGDGNVDLADRDQWLVDAGAMNLLSGNPYLLGDTNLDGVVDGQDFLVWNANKFQTTGKWSQADWNADGITDGRDFLIWNSNKFATSDAPYFAHPTEPLDAVSTLRIDSLFANYNDKETEEKESSIDLA